MAAEFGDGNPFCINCRFFTREFSDLHEEMNGLDPHQGECRRHAPSAQVFSFYRPTHRMVRSARNGETVGLVLWPIVWPDDWCGDFADVGDA